VLLSLVLLLGVSSVLAQDAGSGGVGDEAPPEMAPVVIDGRTLYSVRGITAYPAERRAANIADRILELARDSSFDPALIQIVDTVSYSQIVYRERLLQRITAADADFEAMDRRVLADAYRTRMREAIATYRKVRSPRALLTSARQAAIATVFAILLVFLIWRFLRWMHHWLERRYAGRVRSVSIRSFEILRADTIWGLLKGAVGFLRVVSIILLTVLYLRYAFALFPWTYGVAVNIDQWFFAPITVLWSGFVAKMPNLIFLAVLALVVRYALRLVYLFFVAIGEGKLEFKDFDPSWSEPTYKLVRVAIIAFALIVAYPYIPGSSSEAFKGVSIFFGVVFSLGSTSTISNLLAGYMMIYRRAFREGDVVKIAGLLGYVSRVRLQVTHLRNAKNEEIVIPNSTILAGEVINYSSLAKSDGLILHTTVGIGYETPWRQVEAMLIEAAERTEGIRKDSKPFVLQTALGDFAVTYEINVYCEEPRRMLRIYSALHGNILDVFNEYGIQIMTPAYEGDPDEPKIVPRDKWHTPPAAKLQGPLGGVVSD